MQTKVLIVDDDSVIRKLVSDLLLKNDYRVALAEDGTEGVAQARSFKPDIILLDVIMPGMDGYSVCELLRKEKGLENVSIMMLTALDTVEQKVRGFEAGADDYLAKPFEPEEFLARVDALARRIKALKKREIAEIKSGKSIAVFSLRGGSGTSTIAVNLAAGLAQLWAEPVALVDLVTLAGQSALLLDQSLRHTWTKLAKQPVEEIDSPLVNEVLLPHSSGVHTLASPRRPEDSELISKELVAHVLGLLRAQFNYTVIDLPHDFSDITLAALDQAEEILLPFTPEIAGIRTALVALDTLSKLNFSLENVRLISNWVFPTKGLANEDIERVLKHQVDLTIPYASEDLIKCLTLGVPSVLHQPESPLGELFEDLSLVMSAESQLNIRPGDPSATWVRAVQRAKDRKKK